MSFNEAWFRTASKKSVRHVRVAGEALTEIRLLEHEALEVGVLRLGAYASPSASSFCRVPGLVLGGAP